MFKSHPRHFIIKMLPFSWLLTTFLYTCQIQEQEFQGKMYYAEIHVVRVF